MDLWVNNYSINTEYSKKTDIPSPAPMTIQTEEKDTPNQYGNTFTQTKTLLDYRTVPQQLTQAQFNIGIAMDILSEGKKYQTSVQNSMIPVEYEYYCIPKMDPNDSLRFSLGRDKNMLVK